LLVADPHNTEALTTIRRNTHTLKGSGRMVGLNELGEAAWELEQTLNLWLRQDQWATPELMQLIEDEHTLFSTWVHHLESGQGHAPDPSALVALAGRLRGVEPLAVPLAANVEPLPVMEPPVEPVIEEIAATEAISFEPIELEITPPAAVEVPEPVPSIDDFELSFPEEFPAQSEEPLSSRWPAPEEVAIPFVEPSGRAGPARLSRASCRRA
jgi:chemosensory pili system protein ChpA (sensor histidine kinase/response regulator)